MDSYHSRRATEETEFLHPRGITRGYTQELWDMSMSCWDVEPSKRPKVERVLGTLIIAAKQWEPKYGGFSIQDDCDQTASEEQSDSSTDPEPEDQPVDDTSRL